MVYDAVFNSISVIPQQLVHLAMLSQSSFNQFYAQYIFPCNLLLSHMIIIKTVEKGERGMKYCRSDCH